MLVVVTDMTTMQFKRILSSLNKIVNRSGNVAADAIMLFLPTKELKFTLDRTYMHGPRNNSAVLENSPVHIHIQSLPRCLSFALSAAGY